MAASFALIGLGVATYLTFEKLSGVSGPCLIGGGCHAVLASAQSVVLGVPIAAFGMAWSAVALASAFAWQRTGAIRPLYVLYAGGLAGTLVEVYLVLLQWLVIRAFCGWCVVYGFTVVFGWMASAAGFQQARRAHAGARQASSLRHGRD